MECKRQLLALKRELKCWESMFERKHGRKPTKTDIEESPVEIQDTYKEYHRLKSGSTVKPDPPKPDTPKPDADADDGEVFGAHLNKPKKDPDVATATPARTATWKLRRWTKGQGYSTVVFDGREEEREAGREMGEGCGDPCGSEGGEGGEPRDCDLKADLDELSQEVKVQDLSVALVARTTSTNECLSVVAGQYSGRSSAPFLPSPGATRLRHGRGVSSEWLARLTPSLPPSQPSSDNDMMPRPSLCSGDVGETGLDCGASSEDDSSTSEEEEGCSPAGRAGKVLLSKCAGSLATRTESESKDSLLSTRNVLPSATESNLALLENYVDSTGGGSASKPCVAGATRNVFASPIKKTCDTRDHPQAKSVSRPLFGSPNAQTCVETIPETLSVTTEGKQTDIEPLSPLEEALATSVVASSARVCSTVVQSSETCFEDFCDDFESIYCSPALPLPPPPPPSQRVRELSNPPQNAPETSSSLFDSLSSSSLALPQFTSAASDASIGSRDAKSKTKRAVRTSIGAVPPQSTVVMTGVVPGDQLKSTQKESPCEEDEDCEDLDSNDEEKTKTVKKSKPANAKSVSSQSGSSAVSENFVRLNMKIKRFSKKTGRMTGSAYKRKMWKKNQALRELGGGAGSSSSSRGGGKGSGFKGRNVCFKCGKPGHWARNCTDNGGFKDLGKFAGEKVEFSEAVALGLGEGGEMDTSAMEELARDSPFPSVEDAALMARGIKPEKLVDKKQQPDGGDGEESSQSVTTFIPPPPVDTPTPAPPPCMEPIFPTADDGSVIECHPSVTETLQQFGYNSFRFGQQEAVMRVLSGISTLLVLSTGSGKSLCYQIPAYLYSQRSSCITLVVSPLVSLMEDQARNFPLGLRGACLHTNQSAAQRERVMSDAVDGKINVLLLSPEALVGGAFWRGGRGSLSRLPPLAFACIDEVHCVSEWSHNFRPSYLQIHKVLRERFGVRCVLGLTATATQTTALSVAKHLGIAPGNIIQGTTLPDNLKLSVSCESDREQALVSLLQSSRFKDCHSIIVYCTRQETTEQIAQLLRTCLHTIPVSAGDEGAESEPEPDPEPTTKGKRKRKGVTTKRNKSSKRRKLDWSAESYHAGKMAGQRKKVQTDFMCGKLRVVVATIAFGMGLNKADVRAIIHYNMPKSFESFVQEIGRAGRDGQPAFCHVFIDPQGTDLSELRRHAYSSTLDRYSVKQLVLKAFPKCHCKETKQSSQQSQAPLTPPSQPLPTLPTLTSPTHTLTTAKRWCAGHEVAIPIESTVESLDAKEECLATLLCYLELEGWLVMRGVVKDTCCLKCYGGVGQLRALARKVPAVAAAVARLREKGAELETSSSITFSVVSVANSMGWESYIVRSELSGLQVNDRGTGGVAGGGRSTVLTEFTDPAFRLSSPGDFSPEELDQVCDFLFQKVKLQEERAVEKLHLLHAVLKSVAGSSHFHCSFEKENSDAELKTLVRRYFSSGLDSDHLSECGVSLLNLPTELSGDQERQVRQDIKSLLGIFSDQSFTGRAIARIFHGIASPSFTAMVWGRQYRFWRRHLDVSFNLLCQIATKSLLEFR